MVPRIALLVSFVFVFAGFTRPSIPNDSKAIYTFEAVNTGDGFQAQSNGFFSLTVGFKRDIDETPSHRDRASKLLDKLSRRFEKLNLPQANITVGKVYASTREIILNVRLESADQSEATKTALVEFLSKTPDVAFVGEPKSLRID